MLPPGFVMSAPGGAAQPAGAGVATLLQPVKKLACGLSIERPAEIILPQFLTKRICALRVQLNPVMYCPSMVCGGRSLRGFSCVLYRVARLQFCPASTYQSVFESRNMP